MEYLTVATTADFEYYKKKKIRYEDRDILLLKVDNTYYAIENTCPHMGGSLFDGELEGYRITCPKHKTVFDIRTGEVLNQGKILLIKVKASSVRTYPVRVEEENIKIEI